MSHPPALSLFPSPSFSRPLPGRLRSRNGPSPASPSIGSRDGTPEPVFFPPPPPKRQPQPFRSMFPVYDPNVPLGRQDYYAPAHLPRPVAGRGPIANSGAAIRRPSLPPPEPETDFGLRGLWKAANGWRAVESEARIYCLAMSRPRDAPVYSFSSGSSRPFYKLRLDPTSASANVSLSRHDPTKPFREAKGWQEAISTTIEAESQDGLVAVLMPSAATANCADEAADKERARLVWDDDSAVYFLVHPALAHPFSVAVERSPAYSRTHYTLEHRECPGFLARLTRDGTGGGWLEVDTGVAAKTGAYYMVDVAVAALGIVAASDEGVRSPAPAETFEPPPIQAPAAASTVALPASPPRAVLAGGGGGEDGSCDGRRSRRFISRLGLRRKDRRRGRGKGAELELDVESQDGSLAKGASEEVAKDGRKKPSLVVRALAKVSKALGKCVVGVIRMLVKLLVAILGLAYKCVR
ncbi:acetylserotonin methytransferase-like protein [Ophiocordyceps camponoti-floridani]|uniref:Acetylserotonin methytransferase-like protein n=1 Tax=Ophiocordyceps camponoti-floridani TaxID=2030778 RepID=A0A8H4QAZ4_9HYPO|nr:acetylserotonin methytransferase-like protein [Ophiocordyceps camponoti-floridani]